MYIWLVRKFQHREKLRRVRKAQEARANATRAQQETAAAGAKAGGAPGFAGAPGFPGAAGGFDADYFKTLLFDPEIMAAFQV